MSNQIDPKEEEVVQQKELAALDSYIKLDPRLSRHLEHLEQCMQQVLAGTFGSPLKRNFFVRQTLPKLVVTLLKRGDLDEEEAERANQFLQNVINFVVKFMYDDVIELMETLNRILNPVNNMFYIKYGKDEVSRESMNMFDQEFVAVAKNARWDVSVYLLENLRSFGRAGGFNSILERLRNTGPKPPLTIVKFMVKLVFKVREVLQPIFLKGYAEELMKLSFDYVLKLTDEELKNEDKKLITDISAGIEGLLRITASSKASEITERFNLQVALKCFRSPYLEKRLAGLNDIKEFISLVGRKSEMHSKTQFAYPGLWMDTAYLLEWLKENQILEHLYGQNMHPELIRRCLEIPKFFATESKLEKQHLDLIWDASEGKHESISHLIYFSVGELAAHLSIEEIDYLYEKIKSIPLTSYSTQTVLLIRSFTAHAINSATNSNVCISFILHQVKRTTSPQTQQHHWLIIFQAKQLKNWYGLNILWELIQDTAGVSADVALQALSFLNDFLQWPLCHAQRVPFMEACMKNLKEHKSVCMSLKLLHRIIESFYAKRKKGDTNVGGVISFLEEHHNIKALFFADLVHYKTTVASLDMTEDGKSPAALSHMQQIRDRLDFLEYILSNSRLRFEIEQIDIFWNCLILNARTPEESNMAFSWWLSSQAETSLTDDGAYHLFVQRVPEMNFASLSKEGFSFFEYFFRHVNNRKDKIELTEKNFVVTSFDLLGLDSLWKIALEARDQIVARQAIILLNKLYKQIVPALNEVLPRQREEYIATCMNHLAKASDQLASPEASDAELRMIRCLTLLRSILDEFETRSGAMRQRHGSSTRGVPLTLQVCILNGARFTVQVHSNELVGTLRAKIAERQETPPHLIRLITAGKELKFDAETLAECKIVHTQQIHVTRRLIKDEEGKTVLPDQPPPQSQEDMSAYPSNMLSTQKYFNQLFRLLASSEAVGQKVWDLLMMLPTNKQFLTELASLSITAEQASEQWAELLAPHSIFKLLYSLQIVDSFLQADIIPTSSPAESSTAWCARFLAAGGVKHLLGVVMSSSEEFYGSKQGSKSRACMALLLKIIGFFVTDASVTGGQIVLRTGVLEKFVDPQEFVRRLLQLMWSASGKQPTENSGGTLSTPDSEDGEVVRYAMQLLVAAGLSSAGLLKSILHHPSFPSWLASLLLYTTEETIRKEVMHGLYSLCTVAEDSNRINSISHSFFLQQLLGLLPSINSQSPTCEQYFELLNKLVKDSCEGLVVGVGPSNFTTLLNDAIVLVSTHPIVETRNGAEEDKVLIGLLNFVKTLVSKEPEFKVAAGSVSRGDLVRKVFHQCLFDIPSAENHGPHAPPRGKTRASRNVAFQLLLELARDCEENFCVLTHLLMAHHTPEERRTQWQYLPSGYEKAPCGYVGLKNLGATCYMNSLMQQLFMIPAFRYSIFAAEDKEENPADSLLYQLQVIFAHLQESEKKYYDTRDFCNAYKCDGQPTNTSVQMDVDEFFNMLFDKLENVLKGTNKENILKDFFGGTIINQVISKGCSHVSEREEGFFTLSVEVKNKKTILESLELYVEGDMLEGDNKYFCSSCATKVDALKRCCIKNLPNTLIIHSKRFDFDVELMKRTKLNDLCEFPNRLNMEPYTKEGLARLEAKDTPPEPLHPPEYYEYELSGILVHQGTADSGHYYSFIKERNRNGQWFHFNDVQVESFNTDDIPKACFGGVETVTQWDPQQQKHVTRVQPRHYNAYMLFYDRVRPERIAHSPEITPSQAAALVPQAIFSRVWEENMKFLNDKNIFDVDYFSFLWSLVSLGPVSSTPMITDSATEPAQPEFDQTLQNIQLGTRFIIETLAHAKEKTSFRDCVQYLRGLYSRHPLGCRWFLETMTADSSWIRQMLLICTIPETREVFAGLVIHVISCLMPFEQNLYFEEEEPSTIVEVTPELAKTSGGKQKAATQVIDGELFVPSHGRSKSLVIRFMDAFIGLLKEAHYYWRHFAQYFLVLRDFALLGVSERKYLLSRRLITQLVDFYLGDESPCAKAHHMTKKTKMGDKFNLPHLSHMVEVIAILARGCVTRVSLAPPATSLQSELLQLDDSDTEMLYCQEFYAKVIKENISTRATSDIVNHICWEDRQTSSKMIETIRQAIHDVDYEGFRPYFEVFAPLLGLSDSLQGERVNEALAGYIGVIDANMKYKNATLHAIRFLVDLVPENYIVRQWMFEHLDQWVETWLLGGGSDLVRDSTVQLAMNLIPQVIPQNKGNNNGTVVQHYGPLLQEFPSQAQPATPEAAAMLHTLFNHLLTLLRPAKLCCGREDAKSGMDEMLAKSFWRLTAYARLLRWCVCGPEERRLFVPYNSELYNLIIHVDSMHFEADENKSELVRFWAHVLQGSAELIKSIAESEKMTSRLMDYFISMRPRQYNKAALPSFYQILLMLCDHDAFVAKIGAPHHNFEWAVKSLYLDTGEYEAVADVIIQIIKKCLPNPDFRTKFIGVVANYDKYYNNADNIIRLLDLLLQTPEDSIAFCTSNNLNLLSRFVIAKQERDFEMEESYPLVGVALDMLVRATSWMLSPIDQTTRIQQADIEHIIERWEPKQILLQALITYMDHLPFISTQRMATSCHQLVEILCGVDLGFQGMVLRYLHEQFASRELMQTTRFGGHHRIADVNAEMNYYSFVPQFVQNVLRSGDVEAVRTAIDLAILVAKELLLLPSLLPSALMLVTSMLKHIWEHPQYNQIIRENHRLGPIYVALMLTSVPQSLDTTPLAELIAAMFPYIAGSLLPNHRETIIRTLAEKIRFQIVYINQASSNNQQDNIPQQPRIDTFAALVHTLKALSIVFTDVAMKAQFIHEHQQLFTSLIEMAHTLSSSITDEPSNGSIQQLDVSGLPYSYIQDFVKLVTSITTPQT